jgi:hypothetical protein
VSGRAHTASLHHRRARRAAFLVAIVSLVVCGAAGAGPASAKSRARAASAPTSGVAFQRGDVFTWSTSGGSVQEYSPSGQLVQTVPATSTTGLALCFDPSGDHMIVPGVGLFDSSGNLLPSNWASVTGVQRCVADGLGHVYVINPAVPGGTPATMKKYGVRGNLIRTMDAVMPTGVGPWGMDIAPDECTIYYAIWQGTAGISRFNACTDTQLSLFNNWTFANDVKVLPDWQVLTLDDPAATLWDASGQHVRDFTPPPATLGTGLRSLGVDPSGTSFWMAGGLGLGRFDVATGNQLALWCNPAFNPVCGDVPARGPGMTVYAPPLLGDADVEATVDSNSPGTAEAFSATAGFAGQMSGLHLYVDSSSAAGKAVVGVYANDHGHPGTLLRQATITDLRAGSWNFGELPSVSISAGQRYWIAVLGPKGTGVLRFRDVSGSGRSATSAKHNLTALPTAWASGQRWSSAPISAYGS